MKTKPRAKQIGEEFYLNTAGVLRLLYESTPDDMKPEARSRTQRFREKADAAMAADALRAAPRGLDVVLWETFDGEAIEAALATGKASALLATIDKAIGGSSC